MDLSQTYQIRATKAFLNDDKLLLVSHNDNSNGESKSESKSSDSRI